jgi:hypothetical protein
MKFIKKSFNLFPILLASFLFYSCSKDIEVINIPDINFEKALIKLELDKEQDGKLKVTDDVKNTVNLNLEGSNISNLTGIEVFTSLRNLNCGVNNLQSLNLSNNINLEELLCKSNKLKILDLSKNTKIIKLDFRLNKLDSINLLSNTSLKELYGDLNNLTSLNLTNNFKLKILSIWGNKITSINLLNNSSLKEVNLLLNKLTSIEFGKNLEKINCAYNYNLKNINISGLVKLKSLNISRTQIKELDIYQNHSLIELQTDPDFKELYQAQNIVALNRIANVEKDNFGDYKGFFWGIIILLFILIISSWSKK